MTRKDATMARSERGRARQRARRDAYADGVLARIAARTPGNDIKMMAWNEDLAALLPNHLSQAQRDRLKELYETSPREFIQQVVKLSNTHVHVSQAGKVLMPKAGLGAHRKLVTRTDAFGVKPSWQRNADADAPAVVHTCQTEGGDVQLCEACALDRRREELVRARRTK